MASSSLSVGDVVWVRMGSGSHEEPSTIVEFDCETDYGEDGIKCKLQVSAFEAVFPVDAVRAMNDSPRRRRRAAPVVNRQVVTPSPPLGSSSKITAASDEQVTTPAKSRKRKGVATAGKASKKNAATSPHFSKKPSADDDGGKEDSAIKEEDVMSEDDDEVVPAKPPAKRLKKAVAAAKKLISHDNSSSDEEDEAVSTLEVAKAPAKRKKPAAKKKKKGTHEVELEESKATIKPVAKKKAATATAKGKAKAPVKKKKAPVEVQPEVVDSDESDTDHPFKIEYSTTGRATCRRCDSLITKGSLRISHIPLFRGKPGFKVYRHLKCSVFSEDVQTPEDVGGWKKLKKEDYNALVERVEESKEEIKKEMEELDPDELVPVTFQGEMRPAPPGLTADLLPFQVEGVSWMYHQELEEESGVRGGMLCDEMGMGKTIQAIVTILDNRPKLQHSKPGAKHPPGEKEVRQAEEKLWSKGVDEWNHEMEMNNVPKSIRPRATSKLPAGAARAGTLVICPVIALSQWKSEIEKFTEGGTLTVGTYHGPNRASEMPREMLCKYDIVLTTYQILEQDFRKMTSPNKIKCPNCGGKFKIDKLRVHLKYFCGEGARRTEGQARQRRNRPGGGGGEGGGGGSAQSSRGKGKKGGGSKKTMENKMPAKRIKKVGNYDSESELSDVDATVVTQVRTPRRAATNASKRLSSSKKEWGAYEKDDDSDSYEEPYDSSEVDSSEDEAPPKRKVFAKKGKKVDSSDEEEPPPKRKSFPKKSRKKKIESDSDSDSDAISRARRKQSEALAQVSPKKRGKGQKVMAKKKAPPKKAGAKKKGGKGKGEKGESNPSEDSSSSDEAPVDPMEGIDMDALVKEAMDGSKMSLLHGLCWWRIVLDEAHMIKSRSSQTANAAFALIAVHRWCLSGTPLQNRVGEVYSLIRFLRIDPMAHYFCRAKECNCKSLHYRMMNGKCQDCGHGSVQHFSHFNKHVLNPIQRSGYSGDGRRAMFTLKTDILDKSLLRRTKENRAADMKLPPRIVTIRTVRLHPIEEDFYNALYTQTQSSFNDYVTQGTLLNNYAHIFDLLMRMRQAVDHPYLVVYSKKDMKARASNGATIANGTVDCGICHETPTDRVLSSCCEEGFCRSCVQDYMAVARDEGSSIPCPGCRAPFSIDLNQVSSEDPLATPTKQAPSEPMPSLKEMSNVATGSILRRINLAEFATSTKIEALVEELVRMRDTSPGSKAIVFSQFVNMLDLIRWRLHSDPCLREMGLGAKALHGGMDVKARDASLKNFREDPNTRVLLISLKAGGVALNLTVANHIYLMDPWWNPAAEYQAIDRTHRLGQYRPIRAVRFIAEDTVEERILQLQEKKRLVFDGTIGRDAGSLQMLTVDDMKSLFA